MFAVDLDSVASPKKLFNLKGTVQKLIPTRPEVIFEQILNSTMKNITELLQRVQQGNPQSADQLLEMVYNELRNLAAHKMSHEPPGQTLQGVPS